MKKILEITFRYIFTLSALSLMIFSRSRIGLDNFLPWQMMPKSPIVRISVRLFTVLLIFVWVRLFFMVEYSSSSSVAPFKEEMTIYEQLTELRPYQKSSEGGSELVLLYYLSLLAPIVALGQLAALEVYYLYKIPITSSSLGKCGMFQKLEGKRIFKMTIDKYVIWTIEAFWILFVGLIIKVTFASVGLSSFFLTAGVSMLLQTQILRLKNRDVIQSWVNGGGMYDAIHLATQKLKIYASGNRKGHSDDDNIAGIA